VTDRRLHLDRRALLLVVLCTVVWGFGQLASKVALAQIPPLTQAGLRSAGAALLVMAWARYRRIPLWEKDGTLVPGLIAGLLFAVEFAAVYTGLRHTTAGRLTVFLYLAPFVVAIGMAFISRAERLSPRATVGLLVAFAGVGIAFAEGFSAGPAMPQQWLGDALGVFAAVGWGATTLVIRASSLAPVDPAKTLLYQLGISGIGLPIAGWLAGERIATPLSGLSIGSLLFQIVVVSSASYLVWFWLVRTYAAARLSAFTLLTPIIALLAGAALLSEPLTPRIGVAALAVAVGLVAVNAGPRRRRDA